MPQSADFYDSDFDAQLQGLFQQAERAMTHRTEDTNQTGSTEIPTEIENPPADPKSAAAVNTAAQAPSHTPAFLKPLLQGLESVARATYDNNALLRRMDPASSDIADVQKGMLRLMADLRAIVEARNTVSQNMFSALHQELKGYKDGFLLQTVHRPIIRDLVTLYDDVSELHRQLVEIAPSPASQTEEKAESNPILERVRQIATNVANNLEFIIEVLARLEVTIMPPGPEKLDKLAQKVVSLETTSCQEEDGLVVRSVKRGFLWKDAILRPEEVVIKRFRQTPAPDTSSTPK